MRNLSLLFMICLLAPLSLSAQVDPAWNAYPGNRINPYLYSYLYTPSLFWAARYNSAYVKGTARSERFIEAMKRDAQQQIMAEVIGFYKTQRKYPDHIADGWHNVVAMNYYDLCETVKVQVLDNEVIDYVTDDWEHHLLQASAPVSDCKSSILLVNATEKKKKKNKPRPLDLYFIEYAIDSTSSASGPVPAGTLSFWAGGDVTGGIITVFVNTLPAGELEAGWNEDTPACGDENTLTFKYKSGTHEYRALNSRNIWRGTFTLSPGECRLIILSPENTTKSEYSR